ncbi:MAG: HlyD family efflux transporter periplasmic adaptor subunit, partial [Clostridia bacterium]|nr:HlyD family efflux transporter periplasmic adaptor subunit [Clostridia bacterium]
MDGRISSARSALSTARKNNSKYTELDYSLELRRAEVKNAEKKVESKSEALECAVELVSRETTDALKAAKARLEELSEEKSEADKALLDLERLETLDASIKSGKRSLEQMEMSFEAKKEADRRQKALDDYDMAKKLREINEKREKLSGMQGGGDEDYELLAKYPGVVSEVKFRPGEFVTDGVAAVVVEVEQSGYTVSFSVTNAEAQRIKTGDSATVSDTYWGQKLTATLDKITSNADGKTKTLTFNIFGDVETGQTLSLLVGERSTGYSSVIPKSALHEDSEGKFIYITTTKSTPLGNRYVATRLDVKVIASDDNNVAISTDEDWLYEYMIVSSTKPFEAGDYVRLSD